MSFTTTARVSTVSPVGQPDGLKGVLRRHVDRFAFRDAPLANDWIDA